MGVRGLLKHLAPYGEHVQFKRDSNEASCQVVIDGASFAYFAYDVALAQHASWARHALAAMPSYQELVLVTITLLDTLETHGLKINAIFFDGALPQSKVDIRLDRLQKVLKRMSTFRALHRDGLAPFRSPPCSAAVSPEQLINKQHVPAKLTELPAASFMVSAVMEDLFASRYGSRTFHVPGEADPYCARYVKEHGNIAILTNDSDLIVHDLGQDGAVILLNSLSISGLALLCKRWRPASIAERLMVPNLVPLAYSVQNNHSLGLQEHVAFARNLKPLDKSYSKFAAEYDLAIQLGSADNKSKINLQDNLLDSRLSEYCLQDAVHNQRVIWLGVLIEDTERSSAWHCGRDIRSIAYSISMSQPLTTTIEFIRSGQYRISDIVVEHLPRAELLSAVSQHAEELDRWRAYMNCSTATEFWLTKAVRDVLKHLSADGKSIPPVGTLADIIGGRWRFERWSDIHTAAQVQSAAYSWRILHQVLILEASRLVDTDWASEGHEMITELKERLASLPSLSVLFGEESKLDDRQLAANRSLAERILTDLELPISVQTRSGKRRKDRERKKGAEQQSIKLSANTGQSRFAALSQGEE